MVIVGITSFSSFDEFESKFIGGRMRWFVVDKGRAHGYFENR
jgi:hypothetical protein